MQTTDEQRVEFMRREAEGKRGRSLGSFIG